MQGGHCASVAALVTNERGEVLLIKSPLRGWEFPGGMVESGETLQEALLREIREETGVEARILGFVGVCKNVEKNTVHLDFRCEYVGGALTVSDESTEVRWVAADRALAMVTFPLTRKRLANMLAKKEAVSVFAYTRDPFFIVAEDELNTGR